VAVKQWFVIKIGGELAAEPQKLADTVGRAVRGFLDEGIRVVVVPGGGPQATALQK
jgi:acetylglutamate kinase